MDIKTKLAYGILLAIMALALIFGASMALSQSDAIILTPPTAQDWELFWASIQGTKGLASLGGAVAITQFLLFIFRSEIGVLLGRWRLVLVTLFSTLTSLLLLKTSGLDWPSSFMHSTTLSAFQVFAHQFYKQFAEKKD